MNEYKLSIVIVTMNRRKQVIEAINSCLKSKLPSKFEFIVIDNHSTDGTEAAINNFLSQHDNISYTYKYMDENKGVGGGRNEGFNLSKGEYLYFLDDDAIISDESQRSFFIDTIEYMDKNSEVASVTTRIKDEMLKFDRNVEKSKLTIDNKNTIFKFLGGSHFLRKKCFEKPLYFDIKYGGEEYAPSIIAQDRGFYHVYSAEVYIIHKPEINKWISGSKDMENVLIRGCAVEYATKSVLYPIVLKPIVFSAFIMRVWKHLRMYPHAYCKCRKLSKEIINANKKERIKFSTVLKLYNIFGLTVM